MLRKLRPTIDQFLLLGSLNLAWLIFMLNLPLVSFWRTVVALPFILLLPGYLAYRSIVGHQKTSIFELLSFSVGLSILTIMLTGLGLNELYTLLDRTRPLSLSPITISLSLVTLALTIIYTIRNPWSLINWSRFQSIRKLHWSTSILIVACLILPILAIGGAYTLNNGGSSWLAELVMAFIGMLFLYAIFKRNHIVMSYPLILYSICLAILFGTSMRGWNITGHDIMQEYQVFLITLNHAAWHMHYYHNAYMACLSITILPTVIQRLTGISSPYVYKFVFQLFLALLGPVIYTALTRYIPKRTALLAAFIFVSFPTFLTDITMLNREALALLFLALSLQVGLHKTITRRPKWILILLFLTAMVLSHYSTSYIAVAGLIVALIIGLIWHFFVRRRHHLPRLKNIYSAPLIILILVILIGWVAIITRTSHNIDQTVSATYQTVASDITKHNFNPQSSQSASQAASVSNYAKSAQTSRSLPAADYYPASTIAKYPVQGAAAPVNPPSNWAKSIGLSLNILQSIYSLFRTAYGGLIVVSIIFGIIWSIFHYRKVKLPIQYIFLGMASLIIIAGQVIIPNGDLNYGLTRNIQQGLLFLSLPIILGWLAVLGWLKIPQKFQHGIIAVILVGFFYILSGLLPSLTGGYNQALPLSNSGLYYDVYYTHQDEVSAATWLDQNIPVGSRIYSDEFARRMLIPYAGVYATPTLIPAAIPTDSYVFLSNDNTNLKTVAAYYGSSLIYYKVPYGFLNASKNLVYSSGGVQIYGEQSMDTYDQDSN